MNGPSCKSCRAPIVWARTVKGRRTPLDPGEHEDGNYVVVSERGERVPVVRQLTAAELEQARVEHRPLRRTHFQTCPHSRQHRRR